MAIEWYPGHGHEPDPDPLAAYQPWISGACWFAAGVLTGLVALIVVLG